MYTSIPFHKKIFYIVILEDLKKVYLVLYNLCQYIGFMYVLIVMIIRFSREGPGMYSFVSMNMNVSCC